MNTYSFIKETADYFLKNTGTIEFTLVELR